MMSMSQPEQDRLVYKLARDYLLSFDEVTPDLLELHMTPDEHQRISTIEGLYRYLLGVQMNRQSLPNVIGSAIGGLDNLGSLLYNFNPQLVSANIKDPDKLLDQIIEDLQPRGEVRRTSRSQWPQYCKSIISAARFLAKYAGADDFYSWLDSHANDERTQLGLPLLLACEIHGIGFALACAFLKELGYEDYSKPDVHLKRILADTGLSESSDDRVVCEAVRRIAHNVGVSAYRVDKVLWLVGSGNFYEGEMHVATSKQDFIHLARTKLEKK